MTDDVAHLDATAQAELVRRRVATPLELVDGAIARIEALDPTLNAVTDGFDLLLMPTLAEPPPRLGEFVSTAAEPLAAGLRAARLTPFTTYANVTGQPAISLPLFWSAGGLPIGVQLVAAYGREDLLIRVAAQLEAARPWAGRRPAISIEGRT